MSWEYNSQFIAKKKQSDLNALFCKVTDIVGI